MNKSTQTVITNYPIFVITFQQGTNMCKVLKLHKLCHCIIRWEKFKNSRPVRQCFNCQFSGTLPTSAVGPLSVWNVINSMRRRTAQIPLAPPKNVSTVAAITQLTSQDAPSIYNNSTILNGTTTYKSVRLAGWKQAIHHFNINSHSSPHSRRTNHHHHTNKHGLKLQTGRQPIPLSKLSVRNSNL
jgi:hypothetical protein